MLVKQTYPADQAAPDQLTIPLNKLPRLKQGYNECKDPPYSERISTHCGLLEFGLRNVTGGNGRSAFITVGSCL